MISPAIAARDIGFDRGSRKILSNINLEIRRGEVVALLGPNGAGKSTLLRLMLRLLRPARGSIEICGAALASLSRRALASTLAYVPQHHTPPFPYTVAQVAALGRMAATGLFGMPREQDRDAVTAALDRLGIAHLASRDYTAISGGERQLALIARALVQDARILLLDEPDTGLDYGNQRRLLNLMQNFGDEGYTIVFTTHHPDHALYAANRAIVIDGGGAVADGEPSSVLTQDVIREVYGVGVRMIDSGRHKVFAPV